MPGFNIPNFQFGNCDGAYEDKFIDSSYIPHNIETARSHRFKLTIRNGVDKTLSSDTNDYFTVACETIDRPSPKMMTERVWNYNNYVNIPLRLDYDPISIQFYEVVGEQSQHDNINITSSRIFEWWTRTVFDFNKLVTHFPKARKQTVVIEHLDGFGGTIWSYLLLNCYPLSIIPDQLSHSSGEISRTQVLLNFDACYQARSDHNTAHGGF